MEEYRKSKRSGDGGLFTLRSYGVHRTFASSALDAPRNGYRVNNGQPRYDQMANVGVRRMNIPNSDSATQKS